MSLQSIIIFSSIFICSLTWCLINIFPKHIKSQMVHIFTRLCCFIQLDGSELFLYGFTIIKCIYILAKVLSIASLNTVKMYSYSVIYDTVKCLSLTTLTCSVIYYTNGVVCTVHFYSEEVSIYKVFVYLTSPANQNIQP